MKIAMFGYLGRVVAVLAVTVLGNCLAESRGVVMYQAPPGGYQGLAGVTSIYEGSHAVVVGIDAYQNLPTLRGAVRDAQNVAKALRERGMQVTVLLNQEATRGQIARVLGDTLPYKLKPNERVVIYFSGHGVSVGEPPREMGYLMPIDGHHEQVRSTGISMRELQNWLADYPSKHVLFVADACYSGLALTRSVGLSTRLPQYLKRILDKPVRIAMTAGGRNEEAYEWRDEGLFTHFFLKGISGAADTNVDGLVTSYELVAFVRENVTQTALAEFGAPQNPQLGRTGEGEFVFLTKGELGLQLNHVYRPAGKGPFRSFTSGAVLHSGDHYKIIFTPDRDSYVYLFLLCQITDKPIGVASLALVLDRHGRSRFGVAGDGKGYSCQE